MAKKQPPPGPYFYAREYWNGDSRDGLLVDGDGYHYFQLSESGIIADAFEYYEADDGNEVASALPEMIAVDWKEDLGFEDFDTLEKVSEDDFLRIKALATKQP